MNMLKLLFQNLQIRPILALRRDSQPSGALLKCHLGTSGGNVFQEETEDHLPLRTANCAG